MNMIIKKVTRKIRIKSMYYLYNFKRFYLSLNKNKPYNNLAADFTNNGFVKFSPSQKGISEYLDKKIFSNLNKDILPSNYHIRTKNSLGPKTIIVDINEDFLYKYVFTKEIYDLIHHYYGCDYYLRNNPTIEISYPNEEKNGNQLFHTDWGLRQTSLMINLNSTSELSTHMEYLTKSNTQYYFNQTNQNSDKEKARAKALAIGKKSEFTFGPVEQISIFDAGCGLHRQIPGDYRAMLHLNFVDNFAYADWDKNFNPTEEKSRYFFSKFNHSSFKKIHQSYIPESFFSLVYQISKPRLGQPKIYELNYQFRSSM